MKVFPCDQSTLESFELSRSIPTYTTLLCVKKLSVKWIGQLEIAIMEDAKDIHWIKMI